MDWDGKRRSVDVAAQSLTSCLSSPISTSVSKKCTCLPSFWVLRFVDNHRFFSLPFRQSPSACWTPTSTARRFPNWWTWRETQSSLTVRHILYPPFSIRIRIRILFIAMFIYTYRKLPWCGSLLHKHHLVLGHECDDSLVQLNILDVVVKCGKHEFLSSRQSDDPTHQLWDSLVSLSTQNTRFTLPSLVHTDLSFPVTSDLTPLLSFPFFHLLPQHVDGFPGGGCGSDRVEGADGDVSDRENAQTGWILCHCLISKKRRLKSHQQRLRPCSDLLLTSVLTDPLTSSGLNAPERVLRSAHSDTQQTSWATYERYERVLSADVSDLLPTHRLTQPNTTMIGYVGKLRSSYVIICA